MLTKTHAGSITKHTQTPLYTYKASSSAGFIESDNGNAMAHYKVLKFLYIDNYSNRLQAEDRKVRLDVDISVS